MICFKSVSYPAHYNQSCLPNHSASYNDARSLLKMAVPFIKRLLTNSALSLSSHCACGLCCTFHGDYANVNICKIHPPPPSSSALREEQRSNSLGYRQNSGTHGKEKRSSRLPLWTLLFWVGGGGGGGGGALSKRGCHC